MVLKNARKNRNYVGRYAPSPTGDLHLGNLRTALMCWLHARLHDGKLILRIEDVDESRAVAGAESQIMRDLEWLGLSWDELAPRQTERKERYVEVLEDFKFKGLTYPCYCSRKQAQIDSKSLGLPKSVYSGRCRTRLTQPKAQRSWRLRLPEHDSEVAFRDQVLGDRQVCLKAEVGDFIIRRADDLFAYQLAVAIDDLDQGVTDVVRGQDLVDSTAQQIWLRELVSGVEDGVSYCHLPLMLDASSHPPVKLSKRDGSASIREWRAEHAAADARGLIAHLACSIGLLDRYEPINASELLAELSLQQFVDALLLVQ